MLLIRVVEYGTKPIPDRQPFVPLLRTGDGGRKEASWILDHNGSTELWSPSLSPGGHGNCTSDHIARCPGKGRTGRTPRSSSGPTSVVFNLVYGRPYPAYRLQALLPPLPLFVCFSRGGLGVGEKPTRGELVRSTHRVPSPFISSYDFPSRPFGEPWNSMGLATAYGPFLPAVYHPFVLREAG